MTRFDFLKAEHAADWANRLCAATGKLHVTAEPDGDLVVHAEALTTSPILVSSWRLTPAADGSYLAIGPGKQCSLAEHLASIASCYIDQGFPVDPDSEADL